MKKVAAVLAVLLLFGSSVAACWLVNVWHESKEQEVKRRTEIRDGTLDGFTA